MRNIKWLRFGLGSVMVAGASVAMVLVACGDDDNGGTVAPDGGLTDVGTTPAADTGAPGDSGGDGNTAPVDAGTQALVQVVNAATDFGPSNASGAVRICYALGTSADTAIQSPLPPLPNNVTPGAPFPGIFIGTGGALPSTGNSTDLSSLVVVPYLMNAQSLAARGLVADGGPGAACSLIFNNDAGGAMTAGVDYWQLPALPAGTLAKETSLVLVLTGCPGDSTEAARCGSDFAASSDGGPGNGNLKAQIFTVDHTTPIDPAKIGVQYVNVATPGEVLQPGIAGNPSFVLSDAGIVPVSDAGIPLGAVTPLVQVSGIDVANSSFTTAPALAVLSISLPEIQSLTYGLGVTPPAGGAFANAAAFTFIALGDPSVSPDAGGGAFNPRTFHYLGFPNNPTIPVFAGTP